MNFFLEGLLIVILLIIFFQDLKFRAIHIVLPFFLGILGAYLFYLRGLSANILLYNLSFLAITFSGLFVYLTVKRRSLPNILDHVGLGDLLFFVAIVPYFSTSNFIIFFIGGLLFTIVLHLVLIRLVKGFELVPLAGFVALFMVLIKIISYFIKTDFFDTVLI